MIVPIERIDIIIIVLIIKHFKRLYYFCDNRLYSLRVVLVTRSKIRLSDIKWKVLSRYKTKFDASSSAQRENKITSRRRAVQFSLAPIHHTCTICTLFVVNTLSKFKIVVCLRIVVHR